MSNATDPYQDAATEAWLAIYPKAEPALANNLDYLAQPAPTQAQAAAQIAALTRQVNVLIRVTFGLWGSDDGT